LVELPITTLLGSLCHYITHAAARDFQPMKANFGLLPELPRNIKGKRERAAAFTERAKTDLLSFKETIPDK
jgi:methylenetetrahydrofolate--tRNA-(uracil-5-)-methyltransferase